MGGRWGCPPNKQQVQSNWTKMQQPDIQRRCRIPARLLLSTPAGGPHLGPGSAAHSARPSLHLRSDVPSSAVPHTWHAFRVCDPSPDPSAPRGPARPEPSPGSPPQPRRLPAPPSRTLAARPRPAPRPPGGYQLVPPALRKRRAANRRLPHCGPSRAGVGTSGCRSAWARRVSTGCRVRGCRSRFRRPRRVPTLRRPLRTSPRRHAPPPPCTVSGRGAAAHRGPLCWCLRRAGTHGR